MAIDDCSSLFATIRRFLPLFATIRRFLPLFATIRHFSPLFAAFCHYSPLFATIRHYSHYSRLFALFAIRYSELFAVRYSRLFAIRYSGFPDTQSNQSFVYESRSSPACNEYLLECQTIGGHSSHALTVELYIELYILVTILKCGISKRSLIAAVYLQSAEKNNKWCDSLIFISCKILLHG